MMDLLGWKKNFFKKKKKLEGFLIQNHKYMYDNHLIHTTHYLTPEYVIPPDFIG